MKCAAALAITVASGLVLVGCMHAGRPGTMSLPRTIEPSRAELESAMMPIDLCAGDDSGTCDSWNMPKSIRLISSHCVPIAPGVGDAAVACRAAWREVSFSGTLSRIYRSHCFRLDRIENRWAQRYPDPQRGCEMP